MKKLLSVLPVLIIIACSQPSTQLTEQDAIEFLNKVEAQDAVLGPTASSAYWIGSNFITYDSQKVVADFGKRFQLLALERAREAATFDEVEVSESIRRQLSLIKSSFVMPSPLNEDLATELADISTELEAMYGSGKHCFSAEDCWDLEAFESVIDNSRNYQELLKAWDGWRNIGTPMRDKYLRMIDIGNQGSQDLGYSGLTELWFSKYDMPAFQGFGRQPIFAGCYLLNIQAFSILCDMILEGLVNRRQIRLKFFTCFLGHFSEGGHCTLVLSCCEEIVVNFITL